VQLLGEVLALHLLVLYNSSTTSSTSRLLGKCAAFAVETTFRFSIFVAVNSAHFYNYWFFLSRSA